MESRKIHNYGDMLAAKELPQLWVKYLQVVFDKLGPEVFGQMMRNEQDGRLFGNLTRAGHAVRIDSFYPEQAAAKAPQIDLLGKEINAAILDDLHDPQNSGKVNSTVKGIGVSIADALNNLQSFHDLVAKIQSKNPVYTVEAFQNFILGQAVYFALLPIVGSRVEVVRKEQYAPNVAAEKKYTEKLGRGGFRIPGWYEKKIEEAKVAYSSAAKIMSSRTGELGVMKSVFATIGNYDHAVEVKVLCEFGLKPAAERPGLAAQQKAYEQIQPESINMEVREARHAREAAAKKDSSAQPQKSATEGKKGTPKETVSAKSKSEPPKASRSQPDPPFGDRIRHHDVEADPFAGVRFHSGSPSSSAVLAKAMNQADPKAAMQSVKDAVPTGPAPDKPAASPAQPVLSSMDKMREGFSKNLSSSDSEEEKTPRTPSPGK